MKSETLTNRKHKIWSSIYRASGAVLICCLVVVIGFPYFSGLTWVYGLTIGSALLCTIAAAMLRSIEREETAGDAAWIASLEKRRSGDLWKIMDDADD